MLATETKTALLHQTFATTATATLALKVLQTLPTIALTEALQTPPCKTSHHLLALPEFARTPTLALPTLTVTPTSASAASAQNAPTMPHAKPALAGMRNMYPLHAMLERAFSKNALQTLTVTATCAKTRNAQHAPAMPCAKPALPGMMMTMSPLAALIRSAYSQKTQASLEARLLVSLSVQLSSCSSSSSASGS